MSSAQYSLTMLKYGLKHHSFIRPDRNSFRFISTDHIPESVLSSITLPQNSRIYLIKNGYIIRRHRWRALMNAHRGLLSGHVSGAWVRQLSSVTILSLHVDIVCGFAIRAQWHIYYLCSAVCFGSVLGIYRSIHCIYIWGSYMTWMVF